MTFQDDSFHMCKKFHLVANLIDVMIVELLKVESTPLKQNLNSNLLQGMIYYLPQGGYVSTHVCVMLC